MTGIDIISKENRERRLRAVHGANERYLRRGWEITTPDNVHVVENPEVDIEVGRRFRMHDGFINTLTPLNPIKKHHLDEKYPHFCFNVVCHVPLHFREAFGEYLDKNEFIEPYLIKSSNWRKWKVKKARHYYMLKSQFREWWKSKHVKFYCCKCYRAIRGGMRE